MRNPVCLAIVGASVLVCVFPTHLSGTGQRHDASALAGLVRQYASGDGDAALAGLSQWSDDELRETMRRKPIDTADTGLVKFAIVFFTDQMARTARSEPYLDYTQKMIRGLRHESPADREFETLWTIVSASVLIYEQERPRAVTLVYGALMQDSDPRLQLLAGSLWEAPLLGDGIGDGSLRPVIPLSGRTARELAAYNRGNTRLGSSRDAEYWYRTALKRQPDLVEARLRLGRVLTLLKRRDEARPELERALREAPNSYLRYLAHLFLGIVEEQDKHLDVARTHYEAAMAEYPESQAAAVRLGHVLELLGRADEGRAAVRRLFGDPRHPVSPTRDPWGVYRYAQMWQSRVLVAGMRGLVRQ